MTEELKIYKLFREICPNSNEGFNPSYANLQRWKWHIENWRLQTERIRGLNRIRVEIPKDFEALIEQRRVKRWEDFDETTRTVYLSIARIFTGSPVYACGSRVRGDYIESSDPEEIRDWRRAAGKAEKRESDYDFFVEPSAIQFGEIPKYADQIRKGIPEDEKILIPMGSWDFSKLPQSEHARVVELYNLGKWRDLAAIHDQYQLSNYSYCCDLSGIKTWYRFGIQSGKIADGSKGT